MLTKQKRDEIVKRAKDELDKDEIDYADLYAAITGKYLSIGKPFGYYSRIMLSVVLDLCDTSNMMELPRDKDDKVIHIGDMVWFEGVKETVSAIEMYKDTVYIHLTSPKRPNTFSSPNVLTHVDPISEYERIAQEIEEIADANKGSVTEEDLRLVAEEIRELGESND